MTRNPPRVQELSLIIVHFQVTTMEKTMEKRKETELFKDVGIFRDFSDAHAFEKYCFCLLDDQNDQWRLEHHKVQIWIKRSFFLDCDSKEFLKKEIVPISRQAFLRCLMRKIVCISREHYFAHA
jgi:hypothetical protein